VAAALAACATRGGVGRLDVRADVAEPPRVVPTARGALAVYEIEVRNEGELDATIERLVRNRTGRDAPQSWSGEDLARRAVPRKRAADVLGRLALPPGSRTVLLLETFAPDESLTGSGHDVEVSAPGERGQTWRDRVESSERAVDRSPPVVLGPPLAGGGWLVENGPETLSGHRRAVVWVRRRPRAAQRFAVDFFRVDAERRTHTGDARTNESHLAFGADVLAVADATVAAAADGIPDNVPDVAERAVEMSHETVAGNHVVLDAGDGRFVMYAHLRQGSVRVRPGDRVRRGQVIGTLGNSGNSTEPHLHLHVADGPSPVDASGLPFVLDAFVSDGTQFAGVLPAEGSVVAFPRDDSRATNGAPNADATK
jgi:murein DD-endopeptidase MepM/ murein hydrolase activator NlpD